MQHDILTHYMTILYYLQYDITKTCQDIGSFIRAQYKCGLKLFRDYVLVFINKTSLCTSYLHFRWHMFFFSNVGTLPFYCWILLCIKSCYFPFILKSTFEIEERLTKLLRSTSFNSETTRLTSYHQQLAQLVQFHLLPPH